jgi:hypothetical protein
VLLSVFRCLFVLPTNSAEIFQASNVPIFASTVITRCARSRSPGHSFNLADKPPRRIRCSSDGFASGQIFGLLTGRSPDEARRLGWAHGALQTTYPGDVTMARLDEVEAFTQRGSARVQR